MCLENFNLGDNFCGTYEERRRTWVASVQQDLAARAFLFVEAQWLQGEREGNDVPAAEEEYSSQTVRVMMDVEF